MQQPRFGTAFGLRVALAASLAAAPGCNALIAMVNDADGPALGDGDGEGDGDGDGDISGDGDGDIYNGPPARPGDEGPAPQSRFPRLSHDQWERSVRDLLLLDAPTGQQADLRSDPNPGGAIFVNYGALRVDQSLWQGYQRAAESIAQAVANDADKVAQLAPANDDNAARIDAFIRTHGPRAHRRALSENDVTTYAALFTAAPGYYPDDDGHDAFSAGVRLLVETWLQSPYFLYRPELGETVLGDAVNGRIALDDYEIASRLSYALWGTMPDDTLMSRAAAGQLRTRDDVEQAARTMLTDERADEVIGDFHGRLFEVKSYALVQPAESLGASDDVGAALATEHNLFVNDVFTTGGGLNALLTSPDTFVNAELALIYGLPGADTPGNFPEDDFVPAALDPARRKGVLTQAGFLAKNAAGGVPDPIHRGVFVSARLACNVVPPPPDDIPPYPSGGGTTNREVVESLTEIPGTNCAACHTSVINPYGFPFENYDALGRWQDTDNDLPVDPATSMMLDGQEVSVENGIDLIDTLAASAQVHECYAGNWLNFLYGRERDETYDWALTQRVAEMSLNESASIVDLVAGLVTSEAFRFRNVNEEVTP